MRANHSQHFKLSCDFSAMRKMWEKIRSNFGKACVRVCASALGPISGDFIEISYPFNAPPKQAVCAFLPPQREVCEFEKWKIKQAPCFSHMPDISARKIHCYTNPLERFALFSSPDEMWRTLIAKEKTATEVCEGRQLAPPMLSEIFDAIKMRLFRISPFLKTNGNWTK